MAAFKQNGKWGFIDVKGNIAINPKYDNSTLFSCGRAVMKLNDEYVCIDKNGNQPFQYNRAYNLVSSYINGYSFIYIDGLYGIIDVKGKIVIEPCYKTILSYFSNGFFMIKKDDMHGESYADLIDMNGKTTMFDSINDYLTLFKNGTAKVRYDDNGAEIVGYIDIDGKLLKKEILKSYKFDRHYTLNYLRFTNEDSEVFDVEIILEDSWENVWKSDPSPYLYRIAEYPYGKDMVLLNATFYPEQRSESGKFQITDGPGAYCILTNNGDLIYKNQENSPNAFRNGLSLLSMPYYFYIDEYGKNKSNETPFVWHNYINDLLCVRLDNHIILTNINGQKIIDESFDDVGGSISTDYFLARNFDASYIPVKKDYKWGYVKNTSVKPSSWAIESIDKLDKIELFPNYIYSGYKKPIQLEDFCDILVTTIEDISGKKIEDFIKSKGISVDSTEANLYLNQSTYYLSLLGIIDLSNIQEHPKNIDNISMGFSNDRLKLELTRHDDYLLSRKDFALAVWNILRLLEVYDDVEITDIANVYTDVNSHSKYVRAINYLYYKKLMVGYGNNTFSPNSNMSKEEVLVVIEKLLSK